MQGPMPFSRLFLRRGIFYSNDAGQGGTTFVEAGDRTPGALFSQGKKDHAKTPVPCFLDSDIFFGEKSLPLTWSFE